MKVKALDNILTQVDTAISTLLCAPPQTDATQSALGSLILARRQLRAMQGAKTPTKSDMGIEFCVVHNIPIKLISVIATPVADLQCDRGPHSL